MALAGIETAVALAKRAVEERGENFVYQTHSDDGWDDLCTYFYKGQPDCIVGLIGSYCGLTANNFNDGYGGASEQECMWDLFDSESLAFLNDIQRKQDEEYTWGQAVNYGIQKFLPPKEHSDVPTTEYAH